MPAGWTSVRRLCWRRQSGPDGTTASFARELVRRAVVAAALEGVPVADSHLAAAVEDLMADAETLTRSLLGSGTEASGQPGFPGPGPHTTGVVRPGQPGPGFTSAGSL